MIVPIDLKQLFFKFKILQALEVVYDLIDLGI